MTERWSVERFRKFQKTGIDPGGESAIRVANVESNSGNGLEGPNESEKVRTRCRVVVHCYRARSADPDGVSAKWAIDGLVKCGVFKDDSRKYIEEVSFKETKCKKLEERTEILIFRSERSD